MDRKMETGTASMDSLLLGGGVQRTKERNLSASQPLVVLFKLYMLHQDEHQMAGLPNVWVLHNKTMPNWRRSSISYSATED